MKRLHPPVHLLSAFVATARQSTISAAARELHLTQGAVSKKIKELESLLGVDLFERVHGRLVLSPAGLRYLPEISDALQKMESATLNVMALRGRGGVLNVTTTPTFGAKWLIPRLPAFNALHPEVFLNFMPFTRGNDADDRLLDCSFRYGEGHWPGAVSHYIAGREFVVIASPQLRGEQRIKKRDDLRRHALLQHPQEPLAWVGWCDRYKVAHPNPMGGPKLDQVTAIVRAVMAGLGVGLVPRCLVQEEIEHGLVVAPFADEMVLNRGYYLSYPEAKANIPPLVAFRHWVATQTADFR